MVSTKNWRPVKTGGKQRCFSGELSGERKHGKFKGAANITEHARTQGYDGVRNVFILDGKVISHGGVDYYVFMENLRQNRRQRSLTESDLVLLDRFKQYQDKTGKGACLTTLLSLCSHSTPVGISKLREEGYLVAERSIYKLTKKGRTLSGDAALKMEF